MEMNCPHCGHLLRISDQYAGQHGGCKYCRGRFQVPLAPPVPPPVPPPASFAGPKPGSFGPPRPPQGAPPSQPAHPGQEAPVPSARKTYFLYIISIIAFLVSFVIPGVSLELSVPVRRAKSASPSQPTSLGKGVRILIVGMAYFMTIVMFLVCTFFPLLKFIQAWGWQETPCFIESSAMAKHKGDESDEHEIPTYFADIKYRYQFRGKTYTSYREDLSSPSVHIQSSAKAERFLQRYPAGADRTCYVNPVNPAESALSRGLPAGIFLGTGALAFGYLVQCFIALASTKSPVASFKLILGTCWLFGFISMDLLRGELWIFAVPFAAASLLAAAGAGLRVRKMASSSS